MDVWGDAEAARVRRRPRWPRWMHTPATFIRWGWREGSTWVALIGFGTCAYLFDPPMLQEIGERLDKTAAVFGKLAVGITAALLLARRSRGEPDKDRR